LYCSQSRLVFDRVEIASGLSNPETIAPIEEDEEEEEDAEEEDDESIY
jgi:hypothetical protein